MRNWPRTVISQHNNSAILTQLIESFNDCIDPQTNFQNFYDLIWNIDTAQGYGLDVWGRIVGAQRILTVTTSRYLAFAESADANGGGFGQGQFYAGTTATDNYALSDDVFRLLILAKAFANICDGSIPSINVLLLSLFPGRGNCYVQDGGNVPSAHYLAFAESADPAGAGFDQAPFYSQTELLPNNMTLTYVFEFPLQSFEVSIVTTSGVLPKPAGVKALVSYPNQ